MASLDFRHEAAHVAAPDVAFDNHAAHPVLAADLGRAFDFLNAGQLRQRDPGAVRRRHQKPFQRRDVAAILLGEAHQHRETASGLR